MKGKLCTRAISSVDRLRPITSKSDFNATEALAITLARSPAANMNLPRPSNFFLTASSASRSLRVSQSSVTRRCFVASLLSPQRRPWRGVGLNRSNNVGRIDPRGVQADTFHGEAVQECLAILADY